ncbi:hypothetical protein B0H14DRAFT_3458585 [Mycena olivaceomarginata]|nr:hypothetical protein B0H14DRAFT_3458585 [Mycena olivaceomarginata]
MNPLRSVLRSTARLRPPPRPAFRPFQARPYYVQTAPTSDLERKTLVSRRWHAPLQSSRPPSVLSGLVYATWSTLLVVEALDYEHYLLSTLVHIQRVDYDYSTVPFTTSYAASPQMVDQFFADVAAFDDSGADSAPSASASSSSADASISSTSDDATSDPDLDDKPPQQRRTAAHILILAASAAALLGLIALAEDVGEDVREQLRRLRVQIGGGKERERGYESGSESEVLG